MKAIVKRPGQDPEPVELPDDMSARLTAMQQLVGGFLEPLYPLPGIVLLCDEEGRLNMQQLNLQPGQGLISQVVGPVVMVAYKGENEVGLDEGQQRIVSDWLKRRAA